MMIEPQTPVYKQKYHVVSVELTERPNGIQSGTWYSYVIERGDSIIRGYRSGTLRSVTQHAYDMADDLNERANRKGSTYAPRIAQRKHQTNDNSAEKIKQPTS